MSDLKQDPAYSDGFWAGMDGDALPADASPAFSAGYQGGLNVKGIFASAGFEDDGEGGFSKQFTFSPRAALGKEAE